MYLTETGMKGEYGRDLILRSFMTLWKFVEYLSDFCSFSRRSW